MTDQPTHSPEGIEIMYEGADGWSDWIHPEPPYQLQCCGCGLIHDMEFALVKQDDVSGLTNDLRNHGETKSKVIIFRARRKS